MLSDVNSIGSALIIPILCVIRTPMHPLGLGAIYFGVIYACQMLKSGASYLLIAAMMEGNTHLVFSAFQSLK